MYKLLVLARRIIASPPLRSVYLIALVLYRLTLLNVLPRSFLTAPFPPARPFPGLEFLTPMAILVQTKIGNHGF